jgi:hypothetical protein
MSWPTPAEERVLRAAFSPSTETGAADAIRAIDVRALDERERCLLPLLCPRLRELRIEGPLREAAEAEYLRTASRNTALFEHGGQLVQELETAGIPTMILKGAALVERYYRDPGLRPMLDLDVLVPRERLVAALARLHRAGWMPMGVLTPAVLRTRHALTCITRDGFLCDLHWRPFLEPVPPGVHDALWTTSVEMSLHGARTRAFSPADQLLHVCVHGAQWHATPVLWWVGDAINIVRTGQVDWRRFVSQTVAFRLVVRTREALQYLRDRLGADVPADVVETLRGQSVSASERFERRLVARQHRILGDLPRHWYVHQRSEAGRGWRGWLSFPSYLSDVWALRSTRDLPRAATTRALRRLVRSARGEG